jgi:EAL domain-containing protein (putative c-di-GMP-specific phosphodiesterase class I)
MTATMLRTEDLAALRRCAKDGTLELQYQPEVDLATGAIVAMEGLLRWHRGDLGLLMPLDFLDLAERSGDILSIGEWVLFEAATEAARWQSIPGETRPLWINVSPAQLASSDFCDLVSVAMADAGLPRGALGLEVTEAALAMLGDDAARVLCDLKAAGVSLAVDDFGTWYSTLGAFADLPLDAVKLDHRYVRGVGGDLEDDTIVASVISLAHARGLHVVAEGVESWSESARLTELGCDRAHGYLFSSPQRSDRARWLLSQGAGWRGAVYVPQPREE